MPMPPVEIYTTRWCPYCHAAKALLKRKGVDLHGDRCVGTAPNGEPMIERAQRTR